jgi:hypothetical protein
VPGVPVLVKLVPGEPVDPEIFKARLADATIVLEVLSTYDALNAKLALTALPTVVGGILCGKNSILNSYYGYGNAFDTVPLNPVGPSEPDGPCVPLRYKHVPFAPFIPGTPLTARDAVNTLVAKLALNA